MSEKDKKKDMKKNKINIDSSETYKSVDVLDEADDEYSEFGIFGFLSDMPIFGVEKVSAQQITEESTQEKELAPKEPIELHERDTSGFYDLVYYFGIQVLRHVKHAARRFLALLRRPAHFIAVFAGLIFIFFDKIALRSFHSADEDFRKLRRDAKRTVSELHASQRSNMPLRKRIFHYPAAAVKQHPHLFRTVLNTAIPVVAFAVLICTVSYWTGSTYALEVVVDNNGEQCSLGYISDESVFIEARTKVKDRIDSGVSTTGEEQSLIANPTYKITRVKLNQLSNADAISDKLIENSDSKLTSACGVYIDGKFVCAVKNETDARSVFNSLLENAEKKYKISEDDENSFADFVEDVDFVQGLYSDDEDKMWEASRLLDTLQNKKKSEAVHYTVKEGDSPSLVAQKYGIKTSELMALNPDVDFDVFKSDTKLTIAQEVSFIRVKIIKVSKENVSTPFTTEKTESSKLFKGDKRVVRKGVKGTDKVTYLITYIDGVQTSAKEIERVTLIDPINEKIQIGTKSTTVHSSSNKTNSYGSYKVTTTKGKFVWPVSGLYTITSPYGYRKSGFHTGVDISGGNASGHIVVAADSGTVELVKRSNSSYGNQVIINHGNGVKTRYAHMLNGSISVAVGDRVSRGQAIGRVGSTGNSSGPHLHFEVIVNGNTVNPMNYIGR